MPRGLNTRTRLLASFLGSYVVLATLGGGAAWVMLDRFLAAEAAGRARVVAELSQFLGSPTVRARLEDLTGYRIRVGPRPPPPEDGVVTVRDEVGRHVSIDYRNAAYAAARRTVLMATLGFIGAGTVLVALLSYLLARGVARPLERLAAAARRIGDGDRERPVPAVGSGEVADLAAELDAMRRRLADLDERIRRHERLTTLGTFTAVIAHEIRNPLSAVRLALQMMARTERADPRLPTLLAELERLDLIVDELLAFSRGIGVERGRCELHAVADDVIRLLQRQADHAGVVVQRQGVATVLADPGRLRQLLLNLVLNAIQAQHRDGGRVVIAVRADGVQVRDDGPGVPPSQQATLFDAFTSGRRDGTGLGLHIAHAIAEAHNATLRYRDDPSGACFELVGLDAVD